MRPIMFCVLFLVGQAATAASPAHALVKAGEALYANGAIVGVGHDVGPWRLVPFNYQPGTAYTAQPVPVGFVDPPLPVANTLDLSMVVNDTAIKFTKDANTSKANIWRAGDATLQATYYPGATRYRLRYRVRPGSAINTAEVRIAGLFGQGGRYNLQRDGLWNGRVGCRQGINGPYCHVYVENAKEKYPRGYRFVRVSSGDTVTSDLYLALHTNLQPKDVSRDGVVDLRAYLTGTLTTTMPPEYASMLQSDPLISQAAREIDAMTQASRPADFYLGMDFWLAAEAPTPAAPLVLLNGYESPIWSKPKPGLAYEGLKQLESRALAEHKSWLAAGPRGSLLYGDFPEQPNSYYRVRNVDHYFHCITSWRALLRTGNAEWYPVAKAFANYNRDMGWRDGWKTHGKGLVTWVGPWTVNGHWCDSEALLFNWLCDGDYLSLEEYEKWLKVITDGYPQPTRNDRESTVFKRMADVAYWYTKDARWQGWSKTIEDRFFVNLEKIKATDDYKKHGYGLPTGTQFNPLWTNRSMGLKHELNEGVLDMPGLAARQAVENDTSLIAYGVWPYVGNRAGPGLLGGAYVDLQAERLYEYFRGKPFKAKRRIIYGTQADGVRVNVEKDDATDSELCIAISTRIGGDIPPLIVEVTDPSGNMTTFFDYRVDPKLKFPTYVQTADGGWVQSPAKTSLDGWGVAQTQIPFKGGPGRYSVRLWGWDGILAHGPLSKYHEWQDTTGLYKYPGQDAEGVWPVGSVMVGGLVE